MANDQVWILGLPACMLTGASAHRLPGTTDRLDCMIRKRSSAARTPVPGVAPPHRHVPH